MQGCASATAARTWHIAPHVTIRKTTCRLLVRSVQTPAAACGTDTVNNLRMWITNNGGYVHPALQLTDFAPSSGCRGITTKSNIFLEDLAAGPLVSVPQELQLNSQYALQLIQQRMGGVAAAVAAEQLTGTELVAAALAHEQQQASLNRSNSGCSSFWTPYVQSLPEQPPGPWLLTNSQQLASCVEACRATQPHHSRERCENWTQATGQYRQQMINSAKRIAEVLGEGLRITNQQILISLGHVTSRSLTNSYDSGLVPFIDLLNHHHDARAPMLQLNDNDKLVMTVLPILNASILSIIAAALWE
eukprot:GHRR01014232.1.p1 GENE.GHRR01014232.1~~GHRR01014232.1.p1  ORF type:complete len:304 (+),score=75.73 GHRR01014232.1:168-1079(+)